MQDKIYFEMSDAEMELQHMVDSVDYATVKLSKGFTAQYNTFTTEEVIELQSEASNLLIEASTCMMKLLQDLA